MAEEVQITERMLQAGIDALRNEPFIGDAPLVVAIYEAMKQAEPKSYFLQADPAHFAVIAGGFNDGVGK